MGLLLWMFLAMLIGRTIKRKLCCTALGSWNPAASMHHAAGIARTRDSRVLRELQPAKSGHALFSINLSLS
ncbi:hypothetical protein BDW69DRAFT_162190 [Aspergillus filifer]